MDGHVYALHRKQPKVDHYNAHCSRPPPFCSFSLHDSPPTSSLVQAPLLPLLFPFTAAVEGGVFGMTLSLCNYTQLIHWKALLRQHDTLLGLGAPTGTHLCPITKNSQYRTLYRYDIPRVHLSSHKVTHCLSHTHTRS